MRIDCLMSIHLAFGVSIYFSVQSVRVASRVPSTGSTTGSEISLCRDRDPTGKPDVVSLQWAILFLHIQTMPSFFGKHVPVVFSKTYAFKKRQITASLYCMKDFAWW